MKIEELRHYAATKICDPNTYDQETWLPDENLNQLGEVTRKAEDVLTYGNQINESLMTLRADPFNEEDTRPEFNGNLWATHPALYLQAVVMAHQSNPVAEFKDED